MRPFISIFAVLFLNSSTAMATEALDLEANASALRTYRLQPCSSWRYETDVRGYVCGFQGSSIVVADAFSLDQELSRLDARVTALENQILELKELLKAK